LGDRKGVWSIRKPICHLSQRLCSGTGGGGHSNQSGSCSERETLGSFMCCLLYRGLADDISEMYSKLRRLVLEYLGIPPTPIKQPSDMDASVDDGAYVGLAYTERRGQSAPVPTRRSWSRPSITDSCEVMRSNIPHTVQTKSPPAARSSVVSYHHHHHHHHHHHLISRMIQCTIQFQQ